MGECLVLLVEDHAVLRGILTKSLVALGYQVKVAASADEALALLEEGLLPRLVLTDVRTPGRHNGIDVAQWIKSHCPQIPVLLQTGFAHEHTMAFPILPKPYSTEELSAAIERLLSPHTE